jgi:hypothetical protein
VTCYQWAHKAGIFTSANAGERRQEYLRLRADGIPRASDSSGGVADEHQSA